MKFKTNLPQIKEGSPSTSKDATGPVNRSVDTCLSPMKRGGENPEMADDKVKPEAMRRDGENTSWDWSNRLTDTFPFAEVRHSTPAIGNISKFAANLSPIMDEYPDDMLQPRSLMVISTEIVPPDFSDESALRNEISDKSNGFSKTSLDTIPESVLTEENTVDYSLRELRVIKRRKKTPTCTKSDSAEDTTRTKPLDIPKKNGIDDHLRTETECSNSPTLLQGTATSKTPTMELELIQPTESPKRINVIPNAELRKPKKKAIKGSPIPTANTLLKKMEHMATRKPKNIMITVPKTYTLQKMPELKAKINRTSTDAIQSKFNDVDPYKDIDENVDDSEDEYAWRLESKRCPTTRHESYANKRRVKRMKKERKTNLTKPISDQKKTKQKERATKPVRPEKAKQKSKKRLPDHQRRPPVMTLTIESDDDECFLSKYSMPQTLPPPTKIKKTQ